MKSQRIDWEVRESLQTDGGDFSQEVPLHRAIRDEFGNSHVKG